MAETKITALPKDALVKVLRHYGSRTISDEALAADIAAGAPANPDGTVNLVAYAAWLLKESSHAS